jgi:ribosomal protein S18 acetylase RimI-like enzyme
MIVKTEKLNERAIGFYKSNGFRECRSLGQEIDRYRITLLELSLELRSDHFES